MSEDLSLASPICSDEAVSTTNSDMPSSQLAMDDSLATGRAQPPIAPEIYRQEIARLLEECREMKRKRNRTYATLQTKCRDIEQLRRKYEPKKYAEELKKKAAKSVQDGHVNPANPPSGSENHGDDPVQAAQEADDELAKQRFYDGLSDVTDDDTTYEEAIREEGWNDGFDAGYEAGSEDGFMGGYEAGAEEEAEQAFESGWLAGRRSQMVASMQVRCQIGGCGR